MISIKIQKKINIICGYQQRRDRKGLTMENLHNKGKTFCTSSAHGSQEEI